MDTEGNQNKSWAAVVAAGESGGEIEKEVEQVEPDTVESPDLPAIDICVNLAGKRFSNKKRETILKRAADAAITHVVLCSTDETATKSHLRMVEYYEKNECPVSMVMTAGVHPHDAKLWRTGYSARVFENAIKQNPNRIRVVGECGLDYDRMFSTIEEQDLCFREQIRLAKKTGLPLFLHERSAHPQFVATLEKEIRRIDGLSADHPVRVDGVVHCFTGDYDQLIRYLEMGLHVGITGWVGEANKNRNLDLVDALKRIGGEPDNLTLLRSRMMVETDTPFLSPISRRSPNEPANTQVVLRTVATHLDVPYEELAPEVYQNTLRFFRLNDSE
jgi:TatD DNase family protein